MAKVALTGTGVIAVAGGVGLLALGVYLYYKKDSIDTGMNNLVDSLKKAGAAVLDSVNPASTGNLAYSGVNALGGAATGREFSFGADIRDAAEAGGGTTGFYVLDAINYPANVILRAVKEKAASIPEPASPYDYSMQQAPAWGII